MSDGYTDVELDTLTIERPNGQKFEVIGIQARVYWDDIGSPELIVQHDWADHVLDTSDPWIAEIAAAARKAIMTPKLTARIHEEVVSDRIGKREAAREQQSSWMQQAAE